MYVLHMLVIWAMDRRVTIDWFIRKAHSEALGMVLHAAAFCAATMVAGFVSWHLYEKHFLRLKRFFPDRATFPSPLFAPGGPRPSPQAISV
jgi:peptidoglycan/LPS O-acetylase OafA/YrhL